MDIYSEISTDLTTKLFIILVTLIIELSLWFIITEYYLLLLYIVEIRDSVQ